LFFGRLERLGEEGLELTGCPMGQYRKRDNGIYLKSPEDL
jgi:hypothetical protein